MRRGSVDQEGRRPEEGTTSGTRETGRRTFREEVEKRIDQGEVELQGRIYSGLVGRRRQNDRTKIAKITHSMGESLNQ